MTPPEAVLVLTTGRGPAIWLGPAEALGMPAVEGVGGELAFEEMEGRAVVEGRAVEEAVVAVVRGGR